jgi:hypothetical protein
MNLVTATVIATIWAILLERRRAHEQRQMYAFLPVHVPAAGLARRAPGPTSSGIAPFIRPLSATDRDRFAESWLHTRVQFVDDPARSFVAADQLVEKMLQRGGVEARKLAEGVDGYVHSLVERHPELVSRYREARRIAADHQRGEANHDDLRQALVCYQTVCDELLRPA